MIIKVGADEKLGVVTHAKPPTFMMIDKFGADCQRITAQHLRFHLSNMTNMIWITSFINGSSSFVFSLATRVLCFTIQ